jgi:hypothetical protein
MSDMPPVPTTVHVTTPSVCCEGCEQWRVSARCGPQAGACLWLTRLVIDRARPNVPVVYTPATFACCEWTAR